MHPYCGAVGVSHGCTRLLTNRSPYHSETSWLRVDVAQAGPRLIEAAERPRRPGQGNPRETGSGSRSVIGGTPMAKARTSVL